MLDTLVILTFVLAGAGIGFYGIDYLPEAALQQVTNLEGLRLVTAAFGSLLFWALGLIAQGTYRRLQSQVGAMPADVLLSRAVGLVVGLLIANLLLAPVLLLPIPSEFGFIKPMTAVLSSILFGVSGITLADTHGRALLRLINPNSVETLLVSEGMLKPAIAKVLDTSCIIDGRIKGLLETGFLEGKLLVPNFVLQELQLLADANNEQKRIRGRRGLDLLNQIREAYPTRIVIHPADYVEVPTVDAKLVRLAQDINGILITTDYNLGKVATFQGVDVLNVNDLAMTLRPSYLPGDNLLLKILKEGKEPTQGVGYLEDGTMVVVEEGRSLVGSQAQVIVTGALQTSAGRMIFAKVSTPAIA
jgi:uncharacterized protein YacL